MINPFVNGLRLGKKLMVNLFLNRLQLHVEQNTESGSEDVQDTGSVIPSLGTNMASY